MPASFAEEFTEIIDAGGLLSRPGGEEKRKKKKNIKKRQ